MLPLVVVLVATTFFVRPSQADIPISDEAALQWGATNSQDMWITVYQAKTDGGEWPVMASVVVDFDKGQSLENLEAMVLLQVNLAVATVATNTHPRFDKEGVFGAIVSTFAFWGNATWEQLRFHEQNLRLTFQDGEWVAPHVAETPLETERFQYIHHPNLVTRFLVTDQSGFKYDSNKHNPNPRGKASFSKLYNAWLVDQNYRRTAQGLKVEIWDETGYHQYDGTGMERHLRASIADGRVLIHEGPRGVPVQVAFAASVAGLRDPQSVTLSEPFQLSGTPVAIPFPATLPGPHAFALPFFLPPPATAE
ncbi:MAG: hypothetical protein ACKVYV_13950 [Limisphaerales bacterium]